MAEDKLMSVTIFFYVSYRIFLQLLHVHFLGWFNTNAVPVQHVA